MTKLNDSYIRLLFAILLSFVEYVYEPFYLFLESYVDGLVVLKQLHEPIYHVFLIDHFSLLFSLV
jgi:hypothetical protein